MLLTVSFVYGWALFFFRADLPCFCCDVVWQIEHSYPEQGLHTQVLYISDCLAYTVYSFAT